MAEKQIKTRLQMIGGLTSEWAAASAANKKLLANEIAVEWESRDEDGNYTGFIGMKVGDGIHTFEGLDYFGGEEAHVFTDIIPDATETHLQAIENAVGDTELAVGDIAIIKELIADDKYAYTSYVYSEIETENEDGEIELSYVWKATDGNYSADNVYFDSNLTMTANIGAQTLASGQSSKELATAGKSLEQVMKMILAVEKAPGDPTQPAVTTKIANSTTAAPGTSNITVEGGSTIYPRWNASLSAGSYTYGPATGITASAWSVTDNRNSIDSALTNQTATTASTQNFASMVLPAGKTYKVTATATHGNGPIAYTNLGDEYKAGNDLFDKTSGATIKQILGGDTRKKSDESPTITAWQQGYYIGSLASADTVITSAILRGDDAASANDKLLKNAHRKGANYAAETQTWTFSGKQAKYVVAYPWDIDHNADGTKKANKGLAGFFNGTSFEEYFSNFTESTITVAGADKDLESAHAKTYTLWTWTPAAAFDGDFSFKITLK